MDEALTLVPIFDLTIERGMEIMSDDEYLEITPKKRPSAQTILDRERPRQSAPLNVCLRVYASNY